MSQQITLLFTRFHQYLNHITDRPVETVPNLLITKRIKQGREPYLALDRQHTQNNQ